MKHYKLREGENVRKPVVKRDRIEIHVPVLLICLAMAFLVWLYVISVSKIKETLPGVDTEAVTSETQQEATAFDAPDPRDPVAVYRTGSPFECL